MKFVYIELGFQLSKQLDPEISVLLLYGVDPKGEEYETENPTFQKILKHTFSQKSCHSVIPYFFIICYY